MQTLYDPEFARDFQNILDSIQPVDSKCHECMALMKKWNITYKLVDASPSLFLVHKGNRGGLGLSPYDAHRNAASIRAAGASKAQAEMAAVAIELAPVWRAISPSEWSRALSHCWNRAHNCILQVG